MAAPSGGKLSNFKNELTGCGPFLHDDPRDRPPEIFGGVTTLHFGRDKQPYLLLPIIPDKRRKARPKRYRAAAAERAGKTEPHRPFICLGKRRDKSAGARISQRPGQRPVRKSRHKGQTERWEKACRSADPCCRNTRFSERPWPGGKNIEP